MTNLQNCNGEVSGSDGGTNFCEILFCFKNLERRGVDLVIKNKKKKGEGQVVGRSSNIFYFKERRGPGGLIL